MKVLLNEEIELSISSDETILQAALNQGVNFPHLCRVGGCGRCKCRLLQGEVKKLTETGYLLNEKEIKEGFVLACQTVPQSNLKIEANLIVNNKNANPREFAAETELPLVAREKARLWDYLKFWFFHLFGVASIITLLMGGAYISFGTILIIALLTIGDFLSGEDTKTPLYKRKIFLTASLYTSLPILSMLVFVSVWRVSQGDPLGFGAYLESIFHFNFIAAKLETTAIHHVSAFILSFLMTGLLGTVPAHELVHRTWDSKAIIIGRWLLSFSFDTGFSIEHVYGHHRYVSTNLDPATAPRGRNVYAHVIISTIKGNISAFKIEAQRLKKKDQALFSYHNIYLRGQLMSLLLVVISYIIGGYVGALYFIAIGIFGKFLLEVVNYMEHYGMVRIPKLPVQPRHSWNTNSKLTSWSMFNLSRHSHHHAQGEVPFEDLLPLPDAPIMIGGYLSTIILTLFPPLWFKLMKPKLKDWDENFASKEERELLKLNNLGIQD